MGVAHARGDFIAFCDGDDVADPGWLEALVGAAPRADVVAGAEGPVGEREWRRLQRSAKRRGAAGSPAPSTSSSATFPGGNCGLWTSVARDVGWDEDFTFGGSDVEFAWRAQLAGYRVEP